MKRAIVLSGGGGKGGYQLGFWMAIRKLKIDYSIVTGTSIGAINGAFMVQGNFSDVYKLWYFMDYKKVYKIDMETSGNNTNGKKALAINYTKGALQGGLETPGLEKMIKENIDPDKFFNSDIDYGLVTVKFPSMKPVLMTKNKMEKDKLHDYLIASSCCFPAFKIKNIENESYIDGGYYDNMPINLAIELGADEIIGVDLRAIGIMRKIKDKSVPVTMITPRNKIGSFLVMNNNQTRLDIKLGYNDTMKTFNALDGNFYTFKKGSLDRNFYRINGRFYDNLDSYINNDILRKKYIKIYGKNKTLEFNKVLENTMSAFDLDVTKIYRTSVVNVLIKKKFLKTNFKSYNTIIGAIKNNSVKKMFVSSELICYIYKILEQNKKTKINNLAVMFPNAFLCAIYLKTILRR